MSYIAYKGAFKGLDELNDRAKIGSGKAKEIDILSVGEEDNYGIMYIGSLEVEAGGRLYHWCWIYRRREAHC